MKAELSHSHHLAIERLIKRFETLNNEFCQHHYTIVEEEQAALNDHDEKVTDLIERLQQLVLEPKGATSGSSSASADASMPLQKHLERLNKRIHKINETTRSLHPGPAVDQCLLPQPEEETILLKAELPDTGHAITLLNSG